MPIFKDKEYLRVDLDKEPVTILATHPLAPFRPRSWRLRCEQLDVIADARETFGERLIVAGDFNASPFSPWMRRFMARMRTERVRTDETRLRYAGRGYTTWPASRPVMRIPLDHILVTDNLVVTDFRVGPSIGSDHLPVQATIALRQ